MSPGENEIGRRSAGGIKVVEYATMVSGPMYGKLFADMGAEVVKLEAPGQGDEARSHRRFPATGRIRRRADSFSTSTPARKA